MKRIFLLLAGCLFFAASYAQEPVTFTAEQDHQNMLDQLGIKSIRRGFDADEKSPYAANYDESKANPFPVIPEILRTNAGMSAGRRSSRASRAKCTAAFRTTFPPLPGRSRWRRSKWSV